MIVAFSATLRRRRARVLNEIYLDLAIALEWRNSRHEIGGGGSGELAEIADEMRLVGSSPPRSQSRRSVVLVNVASRPTIAIVKSLIDRVEQAQLAELVLSLESAVPADTRFAESVISWRYQLLIGVEPSQMREGAGRNRRLQQRSVG
jgi:hypothetical protein